MQLGLIVLPSNEAELNAALKALSALGVSATAATIAAPAKATGKAAPVEEPEAEEENLKPVTGPELQAIMTKVRDEKGAEAVTEILTAYGASKLKELDKSDWPSVFAAAETLLSDGDDDLLGDGLDDDDLLGDGLDGEELDPEAVKEACQAHAKKYGKAKTTAILEKNGLNTVRGLAKADQSVLAAIMKAVS